MRPFSPAEIDRIQQLGAAIPLETARAQHIGPVLWDVEATTGDGVTAPVSTGVIGTITVYVMNTTAMRQQASAGGPAVPADTWDGYSPAAMVALTAGGAQPLAVGMALVGGGLRFRVDGVEPLIDYAHVALGRA